MKEYIEREAARRAIEHADPAFCYCIDYVPAADLSPCALCGYGGKHLEAPPCCNCPAYPKEAEREKNEAAATNCGRSIDNKEERK